MHNYYKLYRDTYLISNIKKRKIEIELYNLFEDPCNLKIKDDKCWYLIITLMVTIIYEGFYNLMSLASNDIDISKGTDSRIRKICCIIKLYSYKKMSEEWKYHTYNYSVLH